MREISEPGTRKEPCVAVMWYSLVKESATISRRREFRVWLRANWGAREVSHPSLRSSL